MLRPFVYLGTGLIGTLALIASACTPTSEPATATPLNAPIEGIRGEYVTVRLQLGSNQPCVLTLSSVGNTSIDNYLAPHEKETLTYPDNNNIVVWHQMIPVSTPLGSYTLRVIQLRNAADQQGTEVLSQSFAVRNQPSGGEIQGEP